MPDVGFSLGAGFSFTFSGRISFLPFFGGLLVLFVFRLVSAGSWGVGFVSEVEVISDPCPWIGQRFVCYVHRLGVFGGMGGLLM